MASDELPSDGTIIGKIAIYAAVILGLSLAGRYVYNEMEPTFLGQENRNTRQSLSYITTQQGLLRQFKQSYDGVSVRLAGVPSDNAELRTSLQSQQRSIIAQMRQVRDLIPNDVPVDIRDFLDRTN